MLSKKAHRLEIDNKASALALTRAGKNSNHIAEEVAVAALIKELPLTAHKRQSILPGAGASLLDKFQLLEHVKSAERLAFFDAIIGRALGGSRDLDFLCAVLTRAGYALEPGERSELLVRLNGTRKPQAAVSRCWVALARSATTLSEAEALIRECGRDSLMTRRNRELREFVATVELVSVFRTVERPDLLSVHSLNPVYLTKSEQELKATYSSAHQFLLAQKSWAGNTATFAMLKAMLARSAKTFSRHMAAATSPSERNKVLRSTHARIALELRFGKAFAEEDPNESSASVSRWGIDEMHTVLRAIKIVGEFRITVADRINEFRRVREADGTLGYYQYRDSTIYLSDSVFNVSHKTGREERVGRSPLELVVHEIGHGLSLTNLDKLSADVEKGSSIELADFIRGDHFPDVFLGLGRWYSTSSGFKVDTATGVVSFRDSTGKEREVTLGVTEYIGNHKEARVYNHLPDYRLLIWHEPKKAEFTNRAYAREDPTEMLAELYEAYFSERKSVFRLIQKAPNLFWYMESLYHKYANDKAIQSSLRARLSSKSEPVGISRQLEREAVDQSIFRMLTDEEQVGVLSQLDEQGGASLELKDSRAARSKAFNALAKSASMEDSVRNVLQPILGQYNPAILLARMILAGGGDVAIASLRGTTEKDDLSQQPMYEALYKALGGRFDEKKVFFLDDFYRSKRLGVQSFLKRFETVIAEQLSGLSSRAPGHVKSLPKMYDSVVVYTGIPAVADYLREYARRRGIRNSLKVVEVNSLSSDELAARLLRKNGVYGGDTLHFFNLEDTLLALQSRFRIVMKESRTVVTTIPVRKFLKKTNPRDWLKEVSETTGIPSRLLEVDTSDFTSRAALRLQLDEGSSRNKMLKEFARSKDS